MKQRADTIRKHAKDSATKTKYSNSQIALFQFGEMVLVFGVVFGVGWSLSSVDSKASSHTK
ncbi:hypothetical protein IWW55_001623 [Coemansia sp. RSA 2706]|nr:hypothetical protein IWW55_001623 [Coemansia sp. RSA 2706]